MKMERFIKHPDRPTWRCPNSSELPDMIRWYAELLGRVIEW